MAERAKVDEERKTWQAERDAMDSSGRSTDVLVLNVGGRCFTAKRSTFTLFEDTFLARMFSGRWDGSIERDAHGNFFLDFDPDAFALILSYLRDKKIESPGNPAVFPPVPDEKAEQMNTLLSYP